MSTKVGLHINGVVKNAEKNFSVGFDLTINNGGNVEEVGESIQLMLDNLETNAERSTSAKSEKD